MHLKFVELNPSDTRLFLAISLNMVAISSAMISRPYFRSSAFTLLFPAFLLFLSIFIAIKSFFENGTYISHGGISGNGSSFLKNCVLKYEDMILVRSSSLFLTPFSF